jgi:predicted nucleotidyltransferase
MTISWPAPLMAVVHRMAGAPTVAAIALVGSQASGTASPGSDFDIFVYTDGDLHELRWQVTDEFADPVTWQSVHEYSFGDGDVWRFKDGNTWIDLMYWTTAWGEDQLDRVLVRHEAAMGYSTAFWRSIRDAHPLYERDGWHAKLQRVARQAYPEELRHNIIRLNHRYLREHPFSYRAQVAKAIERDDLVSVNHRVAAWLASYFDILFAINRVLHPGEKRLLEFATRECQFVPDGMTTTVERLVRSSCESTSATLEAIDALTDSLEVILQREGLR